MAAHIMLSPLVVHIGPSERFVRAVFGIKVNNRVFLKTTIVGRGWRPFDTRPAH